MMEYSRCAELFPRRQCLMARRRVQRNSLKRSVALLALIGGLAAPLAWKPASGSCAQGPEASRAPSPEEIERLRQNVERADSTWAAGEAFKALFTKLKR